MWYPKTPQKIAIVQEHTRRWKAAHESYVAECKAADDAAPIDGESIHEITQKKNNPNGAAIMKAWKDRENG